MTRAAFLKNITVTALLTLTFAAALYVALGPRLFSFYGWAASGLLGAIVFSRVLRRRFSRQGISLWPRLLFTVPAVLGAAVQIGFWLAFFHGGKSTVMLGPGRTMVLQEIGPFLAPAAIALTVIAFALIARGASEASN